jgi:ABC-type glycerol-3-phosphate transport system substrate-binding protein
MSKKNILFFFMLALATASYSFVLSKNNSFSQGPETTKTPKAEVTLEFWGIWDNSDQWQKIIDKFEAEKHIWNGQEVSVKINYTKKDISSYETDLKGNYADKKSPSIFIINNYWLKRYTEKLAPLSGKVTDIDEYELLDYEKLQETFPPHVLQDAFGNDNQMYAMPMYIDTMALYYNKNLFQKAGISEAPKTWEEFKTDVKKLTVYEKGDQIKQSGAAMGGGQSISRSCDILSMLILQSGGKIIDSSGNIDFNKKVEVKTSSGYQARQPGLTAIKFFTEFSDPEKDIYAWNDSRTDSLQDFVEGKTAMMFGFGYQRTNISARKSAFELGVAPVPQIQDSTPITISNYWFPVVSNQNTCTIKSGSASAIDCSNIAWSFLSFAAQKENVKDYLNATDKASARLDLISEDLQGNTDISVFAKQSTMARSYNKFDDQIDIILSNMIDAINHNRNNLESEVDKAATMVEALKNK